MTIILTDSDFKKSWDVKDLSVFKVGLSREIIYKADLIYYEGIKGIVILKARQRKIGVGKGNIISKTDIQNFL